MYGHHNQHMTLLMEATVNVCLTAIAITTSACPGKLAIPTLGRWCRVQWGLASPVSPELLKVKDLLAGIQVEVTQGNWTNLTAPTVPFY